MENFLNYTDKYSLEDERYRKLYINGEINNDIIEDIVYFILRYNRLDKSHNIPKEERKPILLYINSIGGDVYPGFALIDVIESSITPVYTINLGSCESMAFLIYIAGHKRYAMQHSHFLLHDGEIIMDNSSAKVQDIIGFLFKTINPAYKETVINNTKIDEETYDMKSREEWYFIAKDAKLWGIVDYIVGKDCTIDEIC